MKGFLKEKTLVDAITNSIPEWYIGGYRYIPNPFSKNVMLLQVILLRKGCDCRLDLSYAVDKGQRLKDWLPYVLKNLEPYLDSHKERKECSYI